MTVLHVAIDARIPSGLAGGVRQVVLGLVAGFRQSDVPLRRTWMVTRDHAWLGDLPSEDEVLVLTSRFDEMSFAMAERFPKTASRARPWVERVRRPSREPFDGLLRRRGVDLVHFTFQDAFDTSLPYVYQPHDLQHRHLPQYFSPAQIRHRETAWRTTAVRAAAVCVGTRWVADDVQAQWHVQPERIAVIPLAPLPENFSGEPARRDDRDVLLYPAAFWPHKRHALLVEALAILRRDGLSIPLVLPGAPTAEHGRISRLVEDLGLADLVTMPGYVTSAELDAWYDRARVVAVPSQFESASFPVWEAMRRGIPAAAADVTALPRQLGDGGLVVRQDSADAWADAIRRLWTDGDLWRSCSTAGIARASRYSWGKTAMAFSSLYTHVAARNETPWRDTVFGPSDLL